MPERPLLRLPNPNVAEVPGGPRPVPNLRKPTKGRQRDRFAPVFDRLQTVLSRPGDPIELQEDPTALAPERVIVFEIGGTVQNFLKALAKVDGLEFMAELEIEYLTVTMGERGICTGRGRSRGSPQRIAHAFVQPTWVTASEIAVTHGLT